MSKESLTFNRNKSAYDMDWYHVPLPFFSWGARSSTGRLTVWWQSSRQWETPVRRLLVCERNIQDLLERTRPGPAAEWRPGWGILWAIVVCRLLRVELCYNSSSSWDVNDNQQWVGNAAEERLFIVLRFIGESYSFDQVPCRSLKPQ